MNSNYLNTAQFAKYTINYNPESKGWANVRGYGTVTFGSVQNDNITKQSYVWNRLQPLDKPFGSYPSNCDTGNCQPSSESTLAWACPKPKDYDNSVFQNN